MSEEKKKSSYLSAKEIRKITKFNRRITKKLEAERADANKDPGLYTTKMQSHWSYIEGTEIIKRRAVFYREI